MTIPTLTDQQKQAVIEATEASIRKAEHVFNCDFPLIPVYFDLKGLKAGMFVYQQRLFKKACFLRYNPTVFSLDFMHHQQDTVPHEVAHYIAYLQHGRKIKPHGKEWKTIAKALGCTAKATGDYKTDGIAIRRQRRFNYSCQCREFLISTTLHNRIQRGQQRICRSCHQPLTYKEGL